MFDLELAAEIVRRLNELVKAPGVPEAFYRLMEHRLPLVGVEKELADHPTIQVGTYKLGTEGLEVEFELGWLGLLNGIVGAIPDGPRKGWGYVMAVVEGVEESEKRITHFVVTPTEEAEIR